MTKLLIVFKKKVKKREKKLFLPQKMFLHLKIFGFGKNKKRKMERKTCLNVSFKISNFWEDFAKKKNYSYKKSLLLKMDWKISISP